MKALLVISVIYINYVIANEKYAVKSFPKKVKPFGAGKILINSPKYMFKAKSPDLADTQVTVPSTGENGPSNKYTVFQLIDHSKAVRGVPDSPYFPVDPTFDQKPRVKKVLPDYIWSSLAAKTRIKRSVPEIATPVSTTEPKSENPITTSTKTTEKKTVKTETIKPVEKHEKIVTVQNATKPEEQKNKNVRTTNKDEIKSGATAVSKLSKRELNPRKDVSKAPLSEKKKKQSKRKNVVVRAHSSKSKKVKSKSKLRRKPKGRNGTSLTRTKGGKKQKSKSALKTKSRSKPKSKNKKSSKGKLRRPKSHKSKKSSKKRAARKGNSTDVKILKETRRLTGARQAEIEDYPYVVSIQKDGEHWCSGALVNQRMVITTANCLWKAQRISRMEVRAGSSYTNRGGQLAGIAEVMKHPKWGLRNTPDYDVALILLDRPIKFSHHVHAVDLPNRVMLPAFDDAWVASFGSERRDGIYEDQENALQVYHSHLISNETCNNITMRFGVAVTSNFICFSQNGKTSPCTRDTGAPAVSDGVLWGLASWGIRKLCGTERFPSMFSYLASHSNMDFIAEATRQMMAEKRLYPFLDRTAPPKLKVISTLRSPTEH